MPLKALFVAVLDLRDEQPGPGAYPGLVVRWLGNRDGDPWTQEDIDGALDFIHEQVKLGKVLVLCNAGMSRSASMVIGYLVRCGWDARSAMAHLHRARPRVAPKLSMLTAVLEAVE